MRLEWSIIKCNSAAYLSIIYVKWIMEYSLINQIRIRASFAEWKSLIEHSEDSLSKELDVYNIRLNEQTRLKHKFQDRLCQ